MAYSAMSKFAPGKRPTTPNKPTLAGVPVNDEEIHGVIVRQFQAQEEELRSHRERAERDRDYRDGIQLTAEEEAILKRRKQPIVIYNRIGPKVDYVLGLEVEMRTDPKAWPRTEKEKDGAEAVTDALRYLADRCDFDQEWTQFAEDIIVEGTGGLSLDVEETPHGVEIKARYIPWDRLWWDHRSRFLDYRDAKYFGEVMWLDYEDALSDFAGPPNVSRDELLRTMEDARNLSYHPSADDTYDDRPRNVWSETTDGRTRVKVVKAWLNIDRVWYSAIITGSGFVQRPMRSPYQDEYGNSLPGMILQSGRITRENERYGLVRWLIGPQDEINKRRSKSLHLLSVRQTMGIEGSVKSPQYVKETLADPQGHLEVKDMNAFRVLDHNDQIQGHVTLLQDAKNEIDTIGVNTAMMGVDQSVQSGIALQTRQQSGMLELKRIFDSLRGAKRRAFRHMWWCVRQFWTEEQWIRVTDDEKNVKFVGLNRPITLYEKMSEQQQLPPLEQFPPEWQIRLSQVVELSNHLATMDCDIVLDESPDVVSLRAQQFDSLMKLAQIRPDIPLQVLIRLSSLPHREQVLELLKTGGLSEEEQAQQAQQQQMAQQLAMQQAQLQMAQQQADVQKTQAQVASEQAKALKYAADAAEQNTEADLQRVQLLASGLGGLFQ